MRMTSLITIPIRVALSLKEDVKVESGFVYWISVRTKERGQKSSWCHHMHVERGLLHFLYVPMIPIMI